MDGNTSQLESKQATQSVVKYSGIYTLKHGWKYVRKHRRLGLEFNQTIIFYEKTGFQLTKTSLTGAWIATSQRIWRINKDWKRRWQTSKTLVKKKNFMDVYYSCASFLGTDWKNLKHLAGNVTGNVTCRYDDSESLWISL